MYEEPQCSAATTRRMDLAKHSTSISRWEQPLKVQTDPVSGSWQCSIGVSWPRSKVVNAEARYTLANRSIWEITLRPSLVQGGPVVLHPLKDKFGRSALYFLFLTTSVVRPLSLSLVLFYRISPSRSFVASMDVSPLL